MSGLTLYGTTTSPYVRRVRIVAHELGIEVDLVDTAEDDGQRRMRAANPVWKVPTVTVGELSILDSSTICEYLVNERGPGELERFNADNLHERNLMTVIDGALDSLINAFYLARDGVTAQSSSYAAKQKQRAASAMQWLEQWATGPWLSQVHKLGLPEIAMVTTLEWMQFRETYDVSAHPKLVELGKHWADRESFARTRPGA
ncbi:MAG: glutathione S-transferase family protein [Nannocystaceae bacterium]|nr:glutathione S-transferase family protein [bacterium]